ncbi:MAG: Phosphoglycolate phosphatase [Chlamydiales bacterium]|nr:Phosphoglycolate phosphatase [Chlamydiales bacterium]MCH9619190.1 Phosphoglycolate phosphatase [Chlamydiales bacterium]MCH9622452.1 Phosphoglycolate phosphatase [Chlamydiales bacterium]
MYRFLILIMFFIGTAFCATKAVVFDYGGVIVEYDGKPLISFIMETFEVEEKEAISLLINRKLPSSNLPKEFEEKFHEAIRKGTHEIPGMLNLVSYLKEEGYLVPLLSNITQGAAKHIDKMGYYDHFDSLFLSFEMGCEKPDPEIYALFLDQIPFAPEEIIFIDDREENVIAARAFGIDAIHFTNISQLTKELVSRGLMQHTIVKREPYTFVGLDKTISSGRAFDEIVAHWEAFFSKKIADTIPHKLSNQVQGLYTNYTGDETAPYSLIIGFPVSKVDDLPPGLTAIEVPGGSFVHYSSKFDEMLTAWEAIWKSEGFTRQFGFDYEVYAEDHSTVDIYVSITD